MSTPRTRRALSVAAILAAVAALLIAVLWGGGRGALPGAARLEAGAPGAEVRGDAADPEGGASAAGAGEPGAGVAHRPTSKAERVAQVQADEREARANRQRLVYSTLSNLRAEAKQAEKEGKRDYAAALRLRAETLARTVPVE